MEDEVHAGPKRIAELKTNLPPHQILHEHPRQVLHLPCLWLYQEVQTSREDDMSRQQT